MLVSIKSGSELRINAKPFIIKILQLECPLIADHFEPSRFRDSAENKTLPTGRFGFKLNCLKVFFSAPHILVAYLRTQVSVATGQHWPIVPR